MDELAIYNLLVKYPDTVDLVREVERIVKADVIKEVKGIIDEIHKRQFYCMADMCEHDSPTVDMCIDCFYENIKGNLQQLKEKQDEN